MIKILVVSIFALGLSACIDESDDENGIDVDVSQFKGAEQSPSLAAASSVDDGDSVVINSEYNGTITDGASHTFAYSALADGLVAIVLTSAAEDIDLFVVDGTTKYSSESLSSNEAVVLQVTANQQYSIEIESLDGAGSYNLVVVEANRSSLGLSADEYWVNFDIDTEETCNTTNTSESHVAGFVINFASGYLADVSGLDKDEFRNVQGNQFSIESSDSGSGTGYSYSSSFKLDLEVNPTQGSVNGSSTSTSTETGFLDLECSSRSSFNGELIL